MKSFREFINEERMTIRSNYSGKLAAFMEELYSLTDEHPFNRSARLYGNVAVEVSTVGKEIHISDIRTMSPGRGAATKAMKMLIDLANRHKITLSLIASIYSNDANHINDLETLVRWYMKMKFRITDDLTDSPDDLDGIDSVDMKYFPR